MSCLDLLWTCLGSDRVEFGHSSDRLHLGAVSVYSKGQGAVCCVRRQLQTTNRDNYTWNTQDETVFQIYALHLIIITASNTARRTGQKVRHASTMCESRPFRSICSFLVQSFPARRMCFEGQGHQLIQQEGANDLFLKSQSR